MKARRMIQAIIAALALGGAVAFADNTPDFDGVRLRNPDASHATKYVDQPSVIKAKATIDFGSTASQCTADTILTIPGAAVGDKVSVEPPVQATASIYVGHVIAANTVGVKHCTDAATVDPADGTYVITVAHLVATPVAVSTSTPTPTATPTNTPTNTPTATPT